MDAQEGTQIDSWKAAAVAASVLGVCRLLCACCYGPVLSFLEIWLFWLVGRSSPLSVLPNSLFAFFEKARNLALGLCSAPLPALRNSVSFVVTTDALLPFCLPLIVTESLDGKLTIFLEPDFTSAGLSGLNRATTLMLHMLGFILILEDRGENQDACVKWNISSTIRGIMPSRASSPIAPSIVCVLPLDACPYAKMVPL